METPNDATEYCQAIICYSFNLIDLLGKDLTLEKGDCFLKTALLLVHLLSSSLLDSLICQIIHIKTTERNSLSNKNLESVLRIRLDGVSFDTF